MDMTATDMTVKGAMESAGCYRTSCKQVRNVLEQLHVVIRFSLLTFSISSYNNLSSPSLRLLPQNWSLLIIDLFTHTLETEANSFSENYLSNTRS